MLSCQYLSFHQQLSLKSVNLQTHLFCATYLDLKITQLAGLHCLSYLLFLYHTMEAVISFINNDALDAPSFFRANTI